MQYRELGGTGLQVSAIGLGCAMLGSSNTEYAVQIVRRALELGVTFFDVARGYRDAEIKVGLGLEGQRRDEVVISTKTSARTRDDAWRQVNESLERLRTDYIDNCHLHGLRTGEDMGQRLGPGALSCLCVQPGGGISKAGILTPRLGKVSFKVHTPVCFIFGNSHRSISLDRAFRKATASFFASSILRRCT